MDDFAEFIQKVVPRVPCVRGTHDAGMRIVFSRLRRVSRFLPAFSDLLQKALVNFLLAQFDRRPD